MIFLNYSKVGVREKKKDVHAGKESKSAAAITVDNASRAAELCRERFGIYSVVVTMVTMHF